MSKTILVVDDEPSICWAFKKILSEQDHTVITVSSAEEGIEQSVSIQPDLIFLDVRLPNKSGLETLPEFISKNANTPVVVMTAFGDLETAVAAVKKGASEYLTKPFSLEEVQEVATKLLTNSTVNDQAKLVKRSNDGALSLIGTSPPMQHIFKQIALVANSDLSVLITGETGTGKEVVAEAIHRHSNRSDKPYFPVAPVAFNEDLIESELFGHVQGSFTGASHDRAGLFEQAEGGTILLDEVGDLPIRMQIKLLRVLEQGHYTRVGDINTRRCNVRIIAATHRDLGEAVKEGSFRQDLFYRLNGLHLHLPPLRERVEDIQPLCEYFLNCIGQDNQTSNLTPALLKILADRDWPGNIRELRNAVEHAAVVAGNRAIAMEDFPKTQTITQPVGEAETSSLQELIRAWTRERLKEEGEKDLHTTLLSILEPEIIRTVLECTNHNRVQASELLGIHRGTLREKMRNYGLDKQDKSDKH